MIAAKVLTYGEFIGRTSSVMNAQGFSFSEVIHSGGREVPVHTHEDPHFLFIGAGEYITSAQNGEAGARNGSLIFNPPGTTHRDRFRSPIGRFFTVSLQPCRYRVLSSDGSLAENAVCVSRGVETWLAARMYREFRHRDSLSATVLEGMALELLGATARHRQFRSKRRPDWISLAVELIRDRCASPLSVDDVAIEVGVHPYHLCRSFRRFLGVTPGEFIRACRLERGTQLLRDSKLSISAVALSCGYADQSQFTRSFKRATGTTPARMRRDLNRSAGED